MIHHDLRFFCSASSISSSACAEVAVKGFSTNTCLPFSSAALASSKCVQTGVITAIASISGELTTQSGIRGHAHIRVSLLGAAQSRLILIADRDDLRRINTAQIADDVRSPISVANDTKSNHVIISSLIELLLPQLIPRPSASIRPISEEHRARSLEDQLQIQPHRPMPRILQIQPYHFVEGRPAPSIDLPQTCDPRHHQQAAHMPRTILVNLISDRRPRSNQRHVSEQNIEKLRQFVQAGAATQELIFFAPSGTAARQLRAGRHAGLWLRRRGEEQNWRVDAAGSQLLHGRTTLARVYLLVDARHGLMAADQDILRTLDRAAVSYQIVLTKADRISGRAELGRMPSGRWRLRWVAPGPRLFQEILATSARERCRKSRELRAAIIRLLRQRAFKQRSGVRASREIVEMAFPFGLGGRSKAYSGPRSSRWR